MQSAIQIKANKSNLIRIKCADEVLKRDRNRA